MPRSVKLVIAATALLVISGGSLRAVASAAPRKLSSGTTSKVMACKYYKSFGISGGSVICFDPGGSACAVCPL